MIEANERAYLETKERQSRDMAAETRDAAMRRAHLNMADAFAAQIAALPGA